MDKRISFTTRSFKTSFSRAQSTSNEFNNILEPEPPFVPYGAQMRALDRFPIGKSTFSAAGEGPSGVNRKARELLFSKFTHSDLVKNRVVCSEWKEDINQIFANVKNLFLFENDESKNAYQKFVSRSDYANDKSYKIKTSNSPTLSIINNVSNPNALVSSPSYLDNFISLDKLTFVGSSKAFQENVHAVLDRIMDNRAVSTLVASGNEVSLTEIILKNANLFCRLKEIHIIESSLDDMVYWKGESVHPAFSYAGGSWPISNSNDRLKVSIPTKCDKTNVFLYRED